MSDKNEPNNMLTIDLSEQSILFLNNALKYMYGKMQTNAQECFSLAEKMFEMYGDFDYSTGIETIEEPLSKIISKTNQDLKLCEELTRAFEHFATLINSRNRPIEPSHEKEHSSQEAGPLREEDL